MWWKCPKGDDHEWKTTVGHRNTGSGCPICSGRKAAKSTSLAILNPHLANEWHPTRNGNLSPYDVSPGSGRKVWWKCTKGEDHEWEAMVNNRTKGSGCAVCVNQIVVDSNCLAKVYPVLAKEWHPTKNGNLKPQEVTFGSHKKVWWKCPKGKEHEWQTSPSHRTHSGTGCPFCTNPSSTPELRILTELRTIFTSVEHRVIINGHEVDIFIPGLKIGIEYDGEFWHRNKQEQDLRKNDTLKDEITLIRVRDYGLPLLTENDIKQKTRSLTLETVKRILQKIIQLRIIESDEVLTKANGYFINKKWTASQHFRKLHAARNHITHEESISYLFPKIAKEWHPVNNEPLFPKYFTPGSNKKVWWVCPNNENHEWESKIVDRCIKRTNCPICANKMIVLSNCLATLNPELTKEWHPIKNGSLTPYDVGVGSNKRVWWKCPVGDDHEWRTAVTHRNERSQGCPICSNKKIVLSNCLATLNAELAKDWHPSKNGKLTPYKVGVGSNRKVWWKCIKGDDHEWRSVLVNRHNGIGCPICSNQKVVNSNSLEILNPKLAKEWHPFRNGKLTARDIGLGSSKKVWWKCPEGDDHEWETSVRNRIKGDGCPICSNRKVVHSNSLATLNPKLAKEWHAWKNEILTPMDVTPGSNKKVWWQNHTGREWQEKVCDRVKKTYKRNDPGQLTLFKDQE